MKTDQEDSADAMPARPSTRVSFVGQEQPLQATIPASNRSPTSSPTRVGAASVRQSLTINDVLGNNSQTIASSSSTTVTQGPTEHEVVTKILKSVETLDVNEGQPQLDQETTQLLADIIQEDLKARSSTNQKHDEPQDPELVPLNPTTTNTTTNTNTNSSNPGVRVSVMTTETYAARPAGTPHKKMHRKSESVEQQLFGLTAALGMMDSRSSSRRGSENFLQDNTSSDRLAKTANVLSDHAKKQAEMDLEAANSNNNNNDVGESGQDDNNNGKNNDPLHRMLRILRVEMTDEMEDNWDVFKEFLDSRKDYRKKFARKLGLYIMLPSLALAILLYHVGGTPTVHGSDKTASFSWLFLFFGVRQAITYTMALATQSLIIDYIVLRTRTLLKWLGPIVTLFFVQSRGWPFIATFWGLYNLILNAGSSGFANNWLFWQNTFNVFNSSNPSGGIPGSYANYLFIALFIVVGLSVSIKRVIVSVALGRQTFAHFGDELAANMRNMVLVGMIAALAKRIEKEHVKSADEPSEPSAALGTRMSGGQDGTKLQALVEEEAEANEKHLSSTKDTNAVDAAKTFIENHTTTVQRSPPRPSLKDSSKDEAGSTAGFTHSMHLQLTELLDSWEEPEGVKTKTVKKITIGSVLQFKQSLTLMSAKYPFSPAFGIADSREACINAAQEVYDRLMLRTPGALELPFETLALVAKDGEHEFDEEMAKELIKIFRPDRAGNLTKLDFVRSIDEIYKSIRLLTANISNSRHTDAAVESIINCVFWFFIVTFVMQELGMDPWAMLVSLSTIFITFSFMFGSTASKYFDGMLFVLLQRPYGVGDRIHFSNPDTDTSIDGSSGWIVEELSLHTTSVYWGATNERATISNGALSNYRVINSARSPNATIYVNMKFAVDTAYEKIETFRAATEQFLKDRPREWVGFVGFRPTEVAVDRGYTNYVTIAQHRQSWQNVGAILSSKAVLIKFLMEVAKQLDMRYSSPPLPVELAFQGREGNSGELSPANIASVLAE